MDKANDIFGQLREIWSRFGAGQKIGVVATTLLVLGAVLGLSLWAGRPDYKRLALGSADLAAVTAKLDDDAIDYRILADGQTLVVASHQHADAQSSLARAGLLRRSDDSEEGGIFGKASPLNREHQRELRAREAEKRLAKSLERFQFINEARVTITPAKDRYFKRGQQKARANIQISANVHPTEAQIQSITHVVLGGVQGLTADQITIADTRGTILKYPEQESGLHRTEVARQRQVEMEKTRKAQEFLNFTYGTHRTLVTVSADIDWTRSKMHEKKFNPESGVTRNRTKSEESRASGIANGGAVGSRSPAGAPPPAAADPDTSSMTTEMKDFDSTETELVKMGGAIKRLSAAVMVDEAVLAKPAKEGQAPEPIDPAELQAEIKKIEEAVSAAIGLDPTRGDRVEVKIGPVSAPLTMEVESPAAAVGFIAEYGQWIKLGLYVTLALAFLVVALRTLKKAQKAMREVLEVSLEDEAPAAAPEEPEPIDNQVVASVRANADLAGRNVRKWLYETAEG